MNFPAIQSIKSYENEWVWCTFYSDMISLVRIMSDDHNITGKVSSRDKSGASGEGFRPTINQNELDLLICLVRSEAGQTTKSREPEELEIAKKRRA